MDNIDNDANAGMLPNEELMTYDELVKHLLEKHKNIYDANGLTEEERIKKVEALIDRFSGK